MRERSILVSLCLAVLVACGRGSPPPGDLASPAQPSLTTLADALRSQDGSKPLMTLAYVFVDAEGARVLDSVSFSGGPTPLPLADADEQVWLAPESIVALDAALATAGEARLVACLISGVLEGPGNFGPGGRYRFLLRQPTFEPLAPLEASIGTLFEQPATYQSRLIRLTGALVVLPDSALLVEQIGADGLPASNARQVKLAKPFRDQWLLEQLRRSTSGTVRYGQVQIEGYWRGQLLTPMAIRPVT